MSLKDIEDIHLEACRKKKPLFIHPETNLSVMTARYLSQRECCGNKCLFCPYKHQNVSNHECSEESCPEVWHLDNNSF